MELCEAMHWTYDDLMNTPHHFVERVRLYLTVRSKWRADREERNSRLGAT